MTPFVPDDLSPDPLQLPETVSEAIRARIHKLADTVQKHAELLVEHKVLLATLQDDLKTKASSAELTSALALIRVEMSAITRKLDEIYGNTGWFVKLVLGALILAIVALVLKKP